MPSLLGPHAPARHMLRLATLVSSLGALAALSSAAVAAPDAPLDSTVEIHAASDRAVARGDAERFIVTLAPGAELAAGDEISPDGSTVAIALPEADASETVAELAADPRVEHVERDIFMPFTNHMDVNDPMLGEQWALRAIGWYEAPYVANATMVTLLDSGIDVRHPDLAGKLPDGRPKIAQVWNSDTDDANVTDVVGHGTATASVAAALTNNGEGMAGIAPAAQVSMVKVGGLEGASLSAAIKGVNWAVNHNARVINMSFGTPYYSRGLRDAIYRAVDRGVIVVAAVGNEGCAAEGGGNQLNYPAGYAHVIGVAASNSSGRIACFSNYGPEVDLSAPGTDLTIAVPRGDRAGTLQAQSGYRTGSGTSFSAPIVAGAAAAIRSQHPEWTVQQVRDTLTASAKDIRPAGWDSRAGAGLLNLPTALAAIRPAADLWEVNDDVRFAVPNPLLVKPGSSNRTISATLQRSNDPTDVYPVKLRRGDTLSVRASFASSRKFTVRLWKPGTQSVSGSARHTKQFLGASGTATRGKSTARLRATRSGTYFVQVQTSGSSGSYSLRVGRR